MQYIWIIMLGIIYVIFLIGSIEDIWSTYMYNKTIKKEGGTFPDLKELEDVTVGFIFLHFLALFFYSLACWFCR